MTASCPSPDRIALISSTRYEWVIVDYGVLCAGAATTTVHPSTIGDLTPSMKLRRKAIVTSFADQRDALYTK